MKIRLVLALAFALMPPTSASASQLIDRNAQGLKLQANAEGEALLTYNAGGKLKHVLAWGGINAIAPTKSHSQVAFKLDYAGGWGRYHRDYWKEFKGSCRAYDGPALTWFVTGCKASDGSYWAIQSWQRMLPNYGGTPNEASSAWELRLSHWTANCPSLPSRRTGPGTSGITSTAP